MPSLQEARRTFTIREAAENIATSAFQKIIEECVQFSLTHTDADEFIDVVMKEIEFLHLASKEYAKNAN